jgi:tetratricopeptide (TPR) repeat protein
MKLSHKIILYILLLIPVCESFAQYSPEEKFNKATDFYSAGKYKEALDEWLSVYSSGIRSSTLQYNIGNAYFKTSNIPGAILFYERALLLKPADEDIQYNLKIARTLIVDKFIEIPDLFFVKWFNFLSLTLSANNWAKISIVTFILSLCALSLYIYTSRYRFKVAGFWLSILFLFLSITTVSFSLRNKKLINDNPDAIILNPLINGKSSPDNSGTDLFLIHEGTKVTIEDSVGSWYEIRLSDGNKGWIQANSLEKI